MRALLLAFLVAACVSANAPPPQAAEIMAPVIGCWRGSFANAPNLVDERCFSVLDGRHVVDTHTVRPTAYSGETTYHLDESDGRITFAYASSDGGRSHGAMTPAENGVVFPEHEFRNADGTVLRLRSTWTFETADSFLVESEREDAGAWRPFMRIRYVRTAPE